MKRKIIKQANQAYTITLPIEWIRNNGLSNKDEIDIEMLEKSLLIKTNNSKVGEKTKVDLTGMSKRMIYQTISALYVKGYDEIDISSKEDLSDLVPEIMSNLIGYAVISQKDNEYKIKDLNFGNYPHLDEVFKRVFQIILVFFQSAIKDVFGEEKENITNLKSRDIEVNKFCLYLQRAINKSSYPDQIKGRALFTYSFELEKIGDEIERFWRTNVKYHPKKNKEIKILAETCLEGLEKAFDGLHISNKNSLGEIYALREKVREKSMSIKINDPHSIRMTRHLVKIVEEAADLNPLNLLIKY